MSQLKTINPNSVKHEMKLSVINAYKQDIIYIYIYIYIYISSSSHSPPFL